MPYYRYRRHCVKDDPVLSRFVRAFVREVEVARSIDTYLVRLSTLLHYAYDIYKDIDETAGRVFSCIEVLRALSPLSPYVEEVVDLIRSDPRHRFLRPFIPYIRHVLYYIRELELSESRELSSEVRPPTWMIHWGRKASLPRATRLEYIKEVKPYTGGRSHRKRAGRTVKLVLLILLMLFLGYLVHLLYPLLSQYLFSIGEGLRRQSAAETAQQAGTGSTLLTSVLRVGDTTLKLDGGWLIVEYNGSQVPFLSIDNTTLVTPEYIGDITAKYTYISRNKTMAFFQLKEIISTINGGNGNVTIDLYEENTRCYGVYNNGHYGLLTAVPELSTFLLNSPFPAVVQA